MMANNSDIEGGRALTYNYVNARAGASSCAGRRNPTNWTYTSVPTATNTRHGYTGHEHLDKFALINMNGRVYDPIIGRFLSPDPYIQAPYLAQNFDRYSYVWNNPLKYVDPSGYKADWRRWFYYHVYLYMRRQTSGLTYDWNDPFTIDAAWEFGVSGGGGGAGGGAPLGGSAASGPGTGGGGGHGAAPLNLGGDDSGIGSPQQKKKDPDFITLIDFTGLQRFFKGNSNVIPIRFGLRKISIDWENDHWEKIVDLQNSTGFFSYTSSYKYHLSVHYGATFQGTVVQYSKNNHSGILADHLDDNGQAMDFLNRPVDRYIQSGDSGDTYQIFFPPNMMYNVVIYEKRPKHHHIGFYLPWVRIG